MTITTEIVKITPELASELLEGTIAGSNYRNLNSRVAHEYAREMREGRWTLTHQGIALDTEGNVIDGQHRLRAVTIAGVPVEMMVTNGLPPSASLAVDIGSKRSTGQALSHAGFTNTNVLAAAARILMTLEHGRVFRSVRTVTPAEVVDWVWRNNTLPALGPVAGRIYHDTGMSASGVLAGLYLINQATHRTDLFDSFVEGVETGAGLPKGDARLALRSTVARRTVDDRHSVNVAAFTVKAWNAYVASKPSTFFRFKRGDEPFPTPTAARA